MIQAPVCASQVGAATTVPYSTCVLTRRVPAVEPAPMASVTACSALAVRAVLNPQADASMSVASAASAIRLQGLAIVLRGTQVPLAQSFLRRVRITAVSTGSAWAEPACVEVVGLALTAATGITNLVFQF
mmetsp:Transcript_10076/g.28220  ORF Transcript_10076/g.28220 Transcript_10076/m.28220 type:complete len:130 (+) Transcript_10076:343-732(+)